MNLPSYSTLGEIPLLCNTTLPYTVRACELCKLLRLSKQSFTEILEIYFSDGRIILNNLIEVIHVPMLDLFVLLLPFLVTLSPVRVPIVYLAKKTTFTQLQRL